MFSKASLRNNSFTHKLLARGTPTHTLSSRSSRLLRAFRPKTSLSTLDIRDVLLPDFVLDLIDSGFISWEDSVLAHAFRCRDYKTPTNRAQVEGVLSEVFQPVGLDIVRQAWCKRLESTIAVDAQVYAGRLSLVEHFQHAITDVSTRLGNTSGLHDRHDIGPEKESISIGANAVPVVRSTVSVAHLPELRSTSPAHFYHGLTTRRLSSFKDGINPPAIRGELSRERAFYMTQHPAHASDHVHLTNVRAADPIALIAFEVELDVVRGRVMESGGDRLFRYLDLTEDYSSHLSARGLESFSEYCAQSTSQSRCLSRDIWDPPTREQLYPPLTDSDVPFDFVFAHVCSGFSKPIDVVPSKKGFGPLFQLAALSPSSWRYLESCAVKIYVEERGP
ncbi:hypothetical protein B0H16DRAFT_1532664 [Mycena metata]|uniref:Uncharacterized protein n=1 Tax=Mycena metata TaxID=1033252 RepID=A0AAD7JBU1_9AGAR|nr:hypothetical protein B0H16DRAFT_1532664 [Mycena metata]